MTRYEALLWASSLLKEAQCETMYAKFFLQALLNETHTQFVLNEQQMLSPQILQKFQEGIDKHIKTGVPYQQLVGWAEFYGRAFTVSQDTLIPRYETEELVEWVIHDLKDTSKIIVDIGTGTGAIAVTLKKECPYHQVIMTDIYQPTLEIAQLNARKYEVDIQSYLGDTLWPLINNQQQVDIIISNPPYIAWEEASQLSKTVLNFDPHRALFAEQQGLAVYERIIQQLPKVLKSQGHVYFEIGHQQGISLTQIVMNYFPEAIVEVKKDLNGKDRMMKISNIIK